MFPQPGGHLGVTEAHIPMWLHESNRDPCPSGRPDVTETHILLTWQPQCLGDLPSRPQKGSAPSLPEPLLSAHRVLLPHSSYIPYLASLLLASLKGGEKEVLSGIPC